MHGNDEGRRKINITGAREREDAEGREGDTRKVKRTRKGWREKLTAEPTDVDEGKRKR